MGPAGTFQSLKCLPHKHGDLSWVSATHKNTWFGGNPSAEEAGRGGPRLADLASEVNSRAVRGPLFRGLMVFLKTMPDGDLWPLRAGTHTVPPHTSMHTHS